MNGQNLIALAIVWGLIGLLSDVLRRKNKPPGPTDKPQTRDPATARPGSWQRPGGYTWRPLERGAADALRRYRGRDGTGGVEPARPTAAADAPKRTISDTAWSRPEPPVSVEPAAVAQPAAPGDSVEYLGSLGYVSAEGISMEGPALELLPQGAGLPPPAEAARARVSPAVRQAVALLRTPAVQGAGPGAAIVLAEILGPPRALRPRRYPETPGLRRLSRGR